MAHIIDTDVLIDVTKGNPAAIAFLESLPDCVISTITAMELVVGATTQRQTKALDASIAAFSQVALTPTIGANAYDLLKRYARSHGLRAFDALIAATALSGGHTLVTRNTRHFRFIAGLVIIAPDYQ